MTPGRRLAWRAAGLLFVALGAVGAVLPLLPTVVFLIVAAWCFAKSNPDWEARLLAHPRYGPHIAAWRERGAIAREGKLAAWGSLAVSAGVSAWLLDGWPRLVAPVAALTVGLWIATRPTA